MKITIEIKDNKADFFLELLKHLKFVKRFTIQDDGNKKQILAGIKKGVEEMKIN